MKKQKNKKQAGITLIALVVTIILLLILAGITISSLTDSGLFSKTSSAKVIARKATAEETVNLKLTEIQITYLGTATLENVLTELQKPEEKEIQVIETRPTEGTLEEIDVVVKGYEEFTFTIGKLEEKVQIIKINEIEKDKWNGETGDAVITSRIDIQANPSSQENYDYRQEVQITVTNTEDWGTYSSYCAWTGSNTQEPGEDEWEEFTLSEDVVKTANLTGEKQVGGSYYLWIKIKSGEKTPEPVCFGPYNLTGIPTEDNFIFNLEETSDNDTKGKEIGKIICSLCLLRQFI